MGPDPAGVTRGPSQRAQVVGAQREGADIDHGGRGAVGDDPPGCLTSASVFTTEPLRMNEIEPPSSLPTTMTGPAAAASCG